jgi:UDP-galactopyranose mutase
MCPNQANFDTSDNRTPACRFQALPTNGYTAFFEALLDHPNISVKLNTDYFEWKSSNTENGTTLAAPLHTYYTGPIDKFFDSDEQLEYRSLRFESRIVMNHTGYVLPASVVNYPGQDFPFTRIIEYKQMLEQPSSHSIVVTEYPSQVHFLLLFG